MNQSPSSELIRLARRHSYAMAEGFADNITRADLPAEIVAKLASEAEQLSVAAGVSFEVAESALVQFALARWFAL